MFHMKNNGSALLRESDTTLNNFPLGLRVLIVDHDQQSLQEMEAILRGSRYEAPSQGPPSNWIKLKRYRKIVGTATVNSQILQEMEENLQRFGYEVTKCVQVEDASTLLRMEGSVFHIIIIERCLLGVNEYELLRIGREMDLPVIVTSEDVQPNIVQWSLENGACDYLPKPIPMSVLNMVWKYMFFNNVSRVKNQRKSWTPDSHEMFVESVQKLGGAAKATPREILQSLKQSNFKRFKNVDREKIASHLQKYREKLNIKKKCRESRKKTNLPTIGGSTSCGNQSDALMTQMDETLPSEQKWNEFHEGFLNDFDASTNDICIFEELPSLDTSQRGISGAPGVFFNNAIDASTNDRYQSVTLPIETNVPTIGGSTSCGNQSNALMTHMDPFTGGQPLAYESLLNDPDELSSLDTFQGGISGGPGFCYNNDLLLGPFQLIMENMVVPRDGIAENFNGDVTAREHFNEL